jgi:hypothetical protein
VRASRTNHDQHGARTEQPLDAAHERYPVAPAGIYIHLFFPSMTFGCTFSCGTCRLPAAPGYCCPVKHWSASCRICGANPQCVPAKVLGEQATPPPGPARTRFLGLAGPAVSPGLSGTQLCIMFVQALCYCGMRPTRERRVMTMAFVAMTTRRPKKRDCRTNDNAAREPQQSI